MSLTGVNEEPGWFAWLSMFPTHTCRLTFYRAVTDNSQRVARCSVTGSAFMYETTGKAHACFVPPSRKKETLTHLLSV